MLSWLVRIFLIVAGAMAEWFIARDSPQFQLVEICMSFFLVVFIVFVMAFWPARWSEYLDRTFRRSR
jgi:hypothetical protein